MDDDQLAALALTSEATRTWADGVPLYEPSWELMEALASLTPRHQQAIFRRFGFGGGDPMTYREVGEVSGGVCSQRACQIVHEAIRSIRGVYASARKPPPPMWYPPRQ